MARFKALRWTSHLLVGLSALVHDVVSNTLTVTSTHLTTTTLTRYRAIPTEPASIDYGANVLANIEDPQAVDPQSVCPGYTASNVVDTLHGITATLNLAGDACNIYGTDIQTLNLTVEVQAVDRLHVQIIPAYIDASNSSQYILPETLVQKPSIEDGCTKVNSDLNVTWTNNPSFAFAVQRQPTGEVLFSTQGKKLVFENQFIEFSSSLLDEYNLYGLGEVIHGLRLGNNLTRTIYAADAGDPIDMNIYGSHPFYLETRYYKVDPTTGGLTYVPGNATIDSSAQYKSTSHGVYLRNAHGQEVLLRAQNVTWRTLGGSIDLYFYAGPTQKEVTTSYIKSATGMPAMQQYFTLGFHQCRWGYHNWTELEGVVDSFEKFGIPLENIWTDIDYMNQDRDFENDQNRFSYSQGATFLQQLHDGGRHYIPIVDSAVYIPDPNNASDAYPPFTNGNNSGVFLKNPDGSLYIGEVWPGFTVFPDWLSGGAGQWWSNELNTWHGNVSFDGIWIDMSEVSSFCVGSCGSGNVTMNPVHPPFALNGEPGAIVYDYPEDFNVTNATEASSIAPLSSSQAGASSSSVAAVPTPALLRTSPEPGQRNVNHPPYVINNVNVDLAVHAVSPDATHVDGTQEYDIHNLFGHQILNATYHALLSVFPGKRPFIIGRSTFVSSGMFAGHWGGDNYSQWRYMFFSIPQALSFSLFGIPMFGVDTCGFNGNSDEELCGRWMQLSAFFPFYRNHNTLAAASQEPYVWDSVADATKTAMQIRFLLMPYLYTLLWQAHTTASTVMRALAWEFPDDPSLAAADRQFLLGSAILVTPVLTSGASTVDGVFPGAGGRGEIWYDWYSQAPVTAVAGQNTTIAAPLGHIPVYIRGGNVLPTQEPAMTTRDARRNPWGVIAALGLAGNATGILYVDDGVSLEPNATLRVQFSASENGLNASRSGTYADTNALANVTVLGVNASVSAVSFNGQSLAAGWAYNGTSKVLSVVGLNKLTSSGAWSSDWALTWM